MKRIIIILWAMTLAVSTFAQGVLKDSIQGDPHIEGLFEYAKSLGFHISENYHFHRLPNKFEKDCLLHVQLYDISEAAPTGNAEEDRKNKEEDERYRGSNKANLLLIDSIRNTFMALAPHASEIYMKEFHLENQDTMLYAMRSGVPADVTRFDTPQRVHVAPSLMCQNNSFLNMLRICFTKRIRRLDIE